MSGLFGNLGGQNKPATTGGAFGGFGSPANSTTPAAGTGGGLFGSAAAAAAQPAQQQGNTGASTGGGLFGNLGGQTSQQPQSQSQPQSQTPGLSFGGFGGTSSTAPANNSNGATGTGGGLFGGLGASTAQPQTSSAPGGGLFGGLGASTAQPAPQTQQSTGNLLGSFGQSRPAPATSQPVAGGSLFGGSTFGATQQTNQNQAAGAQPQNNTQSSQPTRSQPAFFDQLLERGKKRENDQSTVAQFGELPSLQLGLGDIARKVRNIGQGGPTASQRGADSRAHYLLAASGVNTGAALRDLGAFAADPSTKAAAAAPTLTPFDTDLDTYVEGIYRQSTLNLIEQGLEQAKRDFDNFLEENVQMEWDAQRRRIYEHFGLVKKTEDASADFGGTASQAARGAFGRSSRRSRGLGATTNNSASFGASKSVLGAAGSRTMRQSLFNDVAEKAPNGGMQAAPEDRMMREKQSKYIEKVKSLNVSRLAEKVYPILQEFADVEAQPSLDDTSHFVNAYQALAEIVGEKAGVERFSDPGAVKERQYSADYLDDSPISRAAFALRKRILDGSRKFLEKLFMQQLESTISRNAKEASLGGVPSIINKVRGYIRIRSARKELGAENVELQSLNDDYCWVLIFYLLRAGLVDEAAQYVAENERAIKSMDRNFPNYLASYARSEDHRLPQDLQARISNEYSQRSRIGPESSLDPYRMACYKIIGRCELSRRSLDGVNQSMEDWVWLQFALAREVNRVEETAAEVFALEDVRAVIHEVGQRHFVQGAEGAAGVGTYFFLQVLAGQFESAVAWLYPHNYLTAVHFAIALNYYGLLRVNDFNSAEDLLSYTTRQQPQIAFGHLIGYYTRAFRASATTAAADYLALICLNADVPGEPGKRQSQLCHEALRELVLETREFAQLLGDIRSDGQRIKGSIEQRLKLIGIKDEEQFLRQITISAAQIADDNGRVTDAVLLYHLAEEYDNVISICNKALSEAIAVEIGDAPLRLEPLKPRDFNQEQQQQQQLEQRELGQSLSLTAVEDPYLLTRNMRDLYEAHALSNTKIKTTNREACALLLSMAESKRLIEASKWASALDKLHSLNLLPIASRGNISLIRAHASAFNTLPPVVARNIGNLLVWTITACGNQRDVLRNSSYEVQQGNSGVMAEILQVAKDMMVFAGLVRYKLAPRVFEVLARVGGDVGAY
ncbi:hypothetical protein AAFC00_001491 [Neodothiora populina]|uniref:Nuclear pore protein n=1 Tax=Neodothiora populina TaxID=2781224 RepID=A0ABR3PP28_9PEZI